MADNELKNLIENFLSQTNEKSVFAITEMPLSLQNIYVFLRRSKTFDSNLNFSQNFILRLRRFLCENNTFAKAKIIHILRYLTHFPSFNYSEFSHCFNILISWSLIQPESYLKERTSAFKFVYRIVKTEYSAIDISVIQSLISVASEPSDSLCRSSLDLLTDLAILLPEEVSICGGYKIILNSLCNLTFRDQFQKITMVVMGLIECPRTQKLFNPHDFHTFLYKCNNNNEEYVSSIGVIQFLKTALFNIDTAIFLLSDDEFVKGLIETIRPINTNSATYFSVSF